MCGMSVFTPGLQEEKQAPMPTEGSGTAACSAARSKPEADLWVRLGERFVG